MVFHSAFIFYFCIPCTFQFEMKKTRRNNQYAILEAALMLLGTFGCFWMFQTRFRYHFFFIEQNQLFLTTPDCLSEYFRKPAWLACMAGDFLQQFYHFELFGAIVLSVFVLIFGLLVIASLRQAIPSSARKVVRNLLPLAAALCLMALEARLYVYENARLASICALSGGILLWFLYHKAVPSVRSAIGYAVEALVFVAALALCHWLFGYGALAFLFLELLCRLLHHQLPLAAVLAVLLAFCFSGTISTHYRMDRKSALMYPGPGRWVDLEKEIGVEQLLMFDHEYYTGNYQKVIDRYERAGFNKTPEMSFYYSAAAARLGILPEKLLNMKKPNLGTFIHLDSKSNLFTIVMVGELYYLVGDMTYTERACMHANNFSPTKRCARLVKRLAEANLISGDFDGAEKYLKQLRRSFIYRRWAEDHTPGHFSAEFQAEIDAKRPFLNSSSDIRIGDNCHTILTGLLNSNRDNVVALDYLLCTDIIAKQKDMFMRDYEKYGPRECALYERLLK